MNDVIEKKFESLEQLIGKTPLVQVTLRYKGNLVKVYAKLEYYNLTGSIKDRVALNIIKRAYKAGALREGDTICEGTSGNTGIAISAIGSYLGNKVAIFMPDWMTVERVYLLKGFGADVHLISEQDGGLNVLVSKTEEFAAQNNAFLTKQFENNDNIMTHYNTTAPELCRQVENGFGASIDAFVAGVGTGGTFVGISKYLKDRNPDIKIYPLEPDVSLLLSGKMKNSEQHFIHGIGDGFIPKIMQNAKYDGVIDVNDCDSVIMAQMLGKQLGLGVGISSGANLLGALKILEKIGFDKTVVTVFADDNKKYLSSEYSHNFPMKDSYLSKDVELLDFVAVKA